MHLSTPLLMIATRSHRKLASSMMWVVIKIDRLALMRFKMSQICLLFSRSSPAVGSSRRIILGSDTKAMASESRRCIPPESW
mmetsp:Transcript_41784/g.63816  ORF Transcript_41784/g.63816 Transcript_41784/m.63816 type:complete len:82 (-) Transcript_41784:2550-2795(-)